MWGAAEKEPDERGQTSEQPNLIEEPVANASFVCERTARKGR